MLTQSIIMPYHKDKEMLLYTTDLLCKIVPNDVEIIVIGNNNDLRELDVQLNKRIKYYKINESMLYSQTVNYGVSLAHGEIITLCDQDIFAYEDWYQPLLNKLLSSKKIGAVSAKLLNPSNNRIMDFGIEYSLHRIVHPLRGVKSSHPLAQVDRKVSSSSSAILMLRKETYEKVGGMDLDMPYCCSDCDIGLKIGRLGLENWVVANAVAYHKGSTSNKNGKILSFNHLKNDSYTMFWGKNYQKVHPSITTYIQQSVHYLTDVSKQSLLPLYHFINLSGTDEYKWYASQLKAFGKIQIAGYYSYPQPTDYYSLFKLQLYDAVPYSFINSSVPILYFVDYYPSLIDCNTIWARMRDISYDLVMDVHGNVMPMKEIIDNKV